MGSYTWEFYLDGAPLPSWIEIGGGTIAVERITLGSQSADSSIQTAFVSWLDRPYTTADGIAYRLQLVIIWPLSFVVVGILFLTYPIVHFIRGPWYRFTQRRKGHCVQCGYNLADNHSGVCPECGGMLNHEGWGSAHWAQPCVLAPTTRR